MAINVFEGARRVNKVIIFAIIIFGVVNFWDNPPYQPLSYQISSHGGAPTQVEQCDIDAVIKHIDRKSVGGRFIPILLCFKTQPAGKTGEILVPYKLTDDGISTWMKGRYSEEFTNYTDSIANKFTLSENIAKDADSLWMKTRFTDAIWMLGLIIVVLFAFVVATYLIGWIVRGFAGIPNGHDRRDT